MFKGFEMTNGEIHKTSVNINLRFPAFFEKMEVPKNVDLENPVGQGTLNEKNEVSGTEVPNENKQEDLEHGEKDVPEKQGGRYGDLVKEGESNKEVHHMPADSVTELKRNDGPAIIMEKADHRQTASCGNSIEAREYREAQKELIDQGKFRDALQMDIDDIHEKFGDKYDGAISDMLDYVDKLEEEGKIGG